eukprot:TRINITY_DN54793_c0_g1_i1.p1 TRINITY_DN54793_c0_g1~~TRINITY_DN54793_c0_g1_i1.p1  ORF type:complete len:119 (-),score=8.23 TRINITY_DN54793_c0_g1_i1:13-369(-)
MSNINADDKPIDAELRINFLPRSVALPKHLSKLKPMSSHPSLEAAAAVEISLAAKVGPVRTRQVPAPRPQHKQPLGQRASGRAHDGDNWKFFMRPSVGTWMLRRTRHLLRTARHDVQG